MIRDGRAQRGVLAVLEDVEQEPQQGHAEHAALRGQQPQAGRGQHDHGQRPAMPPAAQPAQPPAVRGAIGQRAHHRGGQGGGDGADPGDDGQSHDLVLRGNVLQLQRQHDLQRRLGRHPHAQAGQGKADDPAVPHVLGRFGQGKRLDVLLADRLIAHGWIMTQPGGIWHRVNGENLAMSIAITEEHRALAQTVAGFLTKPAVPRRGPQPARGRGGGLPSFWAGLAGLGLLGLHIPEELGGSGFGLAETLVVAEELGPRPGARDRSCPTVIASAVLAAAGSGELQQAAAARAGRRQRDRRGRARRR